MERTQNDNIGVVDEFLSSIDVFSQVGWRRNNFEILAFFEPSSDLDSRSSGFSINKDLIFFGKQICCGTGFRSKGGWSKPKNARGGGN